MYDIDVVWHTHIVHPRRYHNDTSDILGYVLNHDDTDQERAPGSKLHKVRGQKWERWDPGSLRSAAREWSTN